MKKLWMYLLTAFLSMGFISTVNATVFSIDNFTVLKNGSTLFEDTFSDGLVPPGSDYGTVGSPGPENDGKLALDTATGFAKDSEVSGRSLLLQRNRLLTNTSDDNDRGLKINHDIAVFGIFDLIAPELSLERYGIRLTDFKTDYAFNDNVGIDVQRSSSGNTRVVFREADYGLGMFNVLGETLLTDSDFMMYDQIALSLSSSAGSDEVYAGFSLLGSKGNSDFMSFDKAGHIFDGENWTRAAFIASQVVTNVPEPMSIILFMSGLLGMGFMRRFRC